MTDASDEPAERASSPADVAGDGGGQGDSAAGSGVGRRGFVVGGGAVGLLALGGVGAYLSASSGDAADEPSYILQQGYLRYEVDPISVEGTTVREFYDYTDTSADPPADLVAEDAVSRLFVYDGPVDASLVFLHGSADVDHGGTARFSFSGLSRDGGEWAVRDDPTSVSDDFERWENGNQAVTWEWGEQTSDGGAFWGVLDREEFTVTVTPKTLRGVDAWRVLSGELGDLDRYDLAREKPAKLKPAKGRTVKRANVDVVPDAEEAAFDPYSDERLTVAVRAPPAGADEEAWVDPTDLDPGNYAVNFGAKGYLAGQNAAQPQRYSRADGTLYLEYTTRAANFSLDSAYGYLVSKVDEQTYVRGRDTVQPGGFDNVDEEPAQLVVSELGVDPAGDGTDPVADEYVEFTNDGDEELDLTGYTVADASGATFEVPGGVTLGANERLRLHTGTGDRTASDLYWGRSRAVWNDDGDTVVVRDAAGETVLEYDYPRQ